MSDKNYGVKSIEGEFKMIKKTVAKILSVFLALALLVGVGCGGTSKDDGTKIVLNVEYFDGGFGSEWLEIAAKEFEELYADYTVGDKKGVIVELDGSRQTGQNVYDAYSLMNNEIFFTEQVLNYYDFVNKDYLLDLSDVLTEVIPEQGHSIESVMDEELKKFYGVKEGEETHYYAVPMSSSFCGLIYDEEFFYNNGLFLTREYDGAEQGTIINPGSAYIIGNIKTADSNGEYAALVTENGETYYKTQPDENGKTYYLSEGPDGEYGTYDDGQPRTYEEFFRLCHYMKTYKNTYPFIMMGDGAGYIDWFLDQLFADYEGKNEALKNFTFEGSAENLIDVDDSGNITELPDVALNSEEKGDNAMITKSAGRYYALKFYENMVKGGAGTWLHPDWNKNSSQFDAQLDFMLSIKTGETKAAFLIDGVWWEEESKTNFKNLENYYGEKYKKENRHFKLFSLPKASIDQVGDERVIMDTGYYAAFILSSIAEEKVEIAKKFIQYCFTDAKNKEYTMITGVPRGFEYDLSQEEYESMSSFGQGIWDVVKSGNATIMYPQSTSKYYLDRVRALQPGMYFYTKVDGMAYDNIQEVIEEKNISAEEAFRGIYLYHEDRY